MIDVTYHVTNRKFKGIFYGVIINSIQTAHAYTDAQKHVQRNDKLKEDNISTVYHYVIADIQCGVNTL